MSEPREPSMELLSEQERADFSFGDRLDELIRPTEVARTLAKYAELLLALAESDLSEDGQGDPVSRKMTEMREQLHGDVNLDTIRELGKRFSEQLTIYRLNNPPTISNTKKPFPDVASQNGRSKFHRRRNELIPADVVKALGTLNEEQIETLIEWQTGQYNLRLKDPRAASSLGRVQAERFVRALIGQNAHYIANQMHHKPNTVINELTRGTVLSMLPDAESPELEILILKLKEILEM